MITPASTPDSIESFYGYVGDRKDALLLFAATTQGILTKVNKRLDLVARKKIRSGSIFIFGEQESGMKRWTDGLIWSPSRVCESFLVYREVEKVDREDESEDDRTTAAPATAILTKNSTSPPAGPLKSCKGTYYFKEHGLIKKTISATLNGKMYHLVSYFHKEDVENGVLERPIQNAVISRIPISPQLELHEIQARKVVQKRRRESDSECSSEKSGYSYEDPKQSHLVENNPLMSLIIGAEMMEPPKINHDNALYGSSPVSNDTVVAPVPTRAQPLLPSLHENFGYFKNTPSYGGINFGCAPRIGGTGLMKLPSIPTIPAYFQGSTANDFKLPHMKAEKNY